MNQYAERLGMAQSHFQNSTGLPGDNHKMSAVRHGEARHARSSREFPEYYRWYSQREFTWNNIRQPNRNGLLARDPSVDGVKTGMTEAAGYCLVSSAKRDGMRLIAVVTGTKSMKAREDASLALLNYGFSFYETRKLRKGGDELAVQRVYRARGGRAAVGLAQRPLGHAAARPWRSAPSTRSSSRPRVFAPLAKSDRVGVAARAGGRQGRRRGADPSARRRAARQFLPQDLGHDPVLVRLRYPMPLPLVWLDGRLLPLDEARISPLDRGFLFGDGVYEVLPVFDGRAYRFDAHMERLDRSLREIRMAPPLDRAGWLAIFGKLVHGNGGGDCCSTCRSRAASSRSAITSRSRRRARRSSPAAEAAGRAGRRDRARRRGGDRGGHPLVALRHQVDVAARQRAAALAGGRRRRGRDDPAARRASDRGEREQRARRQGREHRDAAADQRDPPGTTRGVLFELAEREGIASERRPVAEAELRSADEMLIASAGGGIRAVTTLDGRPVGGGAPGPVFRKIYEAFMATSRNSRPGCRHERQRRAVPVSQRIPDQGDGPRLESFRTLTLAIVERHAGPMAPDRSASA